MKLSKAQMEIMNHAKKRIDYARTHDFMHWISKAHGYDLDVDWDNHPNPYLSNEMLFKDAEKMVENDTDGYWKKSYEEEKNGITLVHGNSKTLYKLENLGLIEIIYDSKGQSRGIDIIKVINY